MWLSWELSKILTCLEPAGGPSHCRMARGGRPRGRVACSTPLGTGTEGPDAPGAPRPALKRGIFLNTSLAERMFPRMSP